MELGKSSCATCAGLIRLCGGMDFFPQDSEVRKLLVERLHRLAKNHEHATSMIEHWLETQTVAPKVADLVNLAATQRSSQIGTLPAGCDICNGELWVITDRGAKRCSCARGQALRAKEIENGVIVGARAYTPDASGISKVSGRPPARVAGGRALEVIESKPGFSSDPGSCTREGTRGTASDTPLCVSAEEGFRVR